MGLAARPEKPAMGERMQRVNGPHKRIASALVLVVVVVGVTAATAFGATGQPPPSLTGPMKFPCTADQCAVNPATPRSRVNVVPVVAPVGTTPTFYAGSTPTTGMLHRNTEQADLNCTGYQPKDRVSVQFWIGGRFRGNVTYRVTDVVSNANPAALQFCLGATFPFTNASLLPATATTLPNGYAQITPRGSTMVLDDDHIALWERGKGSTTAAMRDGTKVTVYFRKPQLRADGVLPKGGIARFYGTAQVVKSGPQYEEVWRRLAA